MHNRKLEEGIGGVMGISMNDLTAQKKLEKVNLIKRIITMVFGVGSVVMFFLPYAQVVFKDTKYVTSGFGFINCKWIPCGNRYNQRFNWYPSFD